MAGLEAKSSGWASTESPLHAFSLSRSSEGALSSRPGRLGWRRAFGALWSQVALRGRLERDADPEEVGARARVHVEVVHRCLLAQWKAPVGGRGPVLRCGAVALELSARVWQAFGPAAGVRQVHLLCRLEDALAASERQIRAAELPWLVNRAAVSMAARGATAAIDDLLGGVVDRADALAALEDTAVELAALAVRIALSLDEIDGARRGVRAKRGVALERHLGSLVSEVGAAARARRSIRGVRGEDGMGNHVGVWLSAALELGPPAAAIEQELAGLDSSDPCLRSDARSSLRARWLGLAVALWLIVQELDGLLAIMTFGDDARLERALVSRVSSALVVCDLCRRPSDFDHREAGSQQREALHELVGDVCLALQTCEADAVVRSQQLALRRLARVLAALWAIDERVRSPAQEQSRRCP